MSEIELKLGKAIREAVEANYGGAHGLPISYKDLKDITEVCLAVLVTEKLVHTKESIDLHKAEQQIHGFKAAKNGWTWAELVNAMGLRKEEWLKIKQDFSIGYLTAKDVDEITNYFK